MGLGLPALAARVFDDPGWQGAALYRAGNFDASTEAFSQASEMLNLGNAHVQAGRYAAALEVYDLARLAGDAQAEANFDLLMAFYAGLALDPETSNAWGRQKEGHGPVVAASVAKQSHRSSSILF